MSDKIDEAPLTLEALEEDLVFALDAAIGARDGLSANTLLLFNLVIELSRLKVIDGKGFITRLRSQVELIPKANEQLAAQVHLDELLSALHVRETEIPSHTLN